MKDGKECVEDLGAADIDIRQADPKEPGVRFFRLFPETGSRGFSGGFVMKGIQGITRGFRPPCIRLLGLEERCWMVMLFCILSWGGRRILMYVTRMGFWEERRWRGLFLTAKN